MKYEFSLAEVRILQKAMALYSGYAVNNEKTDLKLCYILLKKLLGK